jgi:hypothetical protein
MIFTRYDVYGGQTKRRLPTLPGSCFVNVRRGASGKAFPNSVWEREILLVQEPDRSFPNILHPTKVPSGAS